MIIHILRTRLGGQLIGFEGSNFSRAWRVKRQSIRPTLTTLSANSTQMYAQRVPWLVYADSIMVKELSYVCLTRSALQTFSAAYRARDTHIMQVNIGWDQCMNPSDSSKHVVLCSLSFFVGFVLFVPRHDSVINSTHDATSVRLSRDWSRSVHTGITRLITR